jgi:putative membrane protein
MLTAGPASAGTGTIPAMEPREDATRRTHLANERTFLAWWRTGLTALAAGIALGRVVPELSSKTKALDLAGGVIFALLGVAFVAYGTYREKVVRAAVARGEFAHPDWRVILGFAVVGVGLGALVVALILASS